MTKFARDVHTINLGHEQMMIFADDRGSSQRVLFGSTWLSGSPASRVHEFTSERYMLSAHANDALATVTDVTAGSTSDHASAVWANVAQVLRALRLALRRTVVRLQFGPVAGAADA
jgi:hypothetical protein